MKIQGAVVKEQGQVFAIIIVKQSALSSDYNAQEVARSFAPLFPGMPIVLMAQDTRGVPTYWGRQDIVNFLVSIHISQIPWKEYTFN